MGRGPNALRVWYMLKYLCTCGAVAAVSRYEWWCVLLECICTLSLDLRLLQARSIPTSPTSALEGLDLDMRRAGLGL
jgi:hypothetical protein